VVRLAAGIALLLVMPAGAQVPSPEAELRLDDLLRARRFAEAEQLISEQMRALPKWEKGHLILAQIYTQRGRYDAAERSASAALRIRQSADGLLLLAVAEMHLNRLNDSVSSLEQAARLQPERAEIYNVLGTVYALDGWVEEAEKAFARAVQLGPSNWEYHYAHGRTLFDLGRFRDAVGELSRAVELSQGSAGLCRCRVFVAFAATGLSVHA
jgi:tetratricopeptide (TPR) repeat protein